MKSLLATLAVSLLSVIDASAAQRLQTPSEIAFSIRQMGVPVEGRFRKFDADLSFDPARPQQGRVRISVDTASAAFGTPDIDAELPKSGWLGTTKFPQATFQSTSIRSTGGDRYEVAGKLSLKGVDRDLTIPLRVVPANGGLVASGTFTVRRLDHKVGEGEWSDTSLVANEVQVRFSLSVAGTPSP